jgi:DNA invertase Pin-like site-specific DNA recombinase
MAYERREDLLSAKLTEEQVEELLDMRKRGVPLKQVAKHFNVHYNTVINIMNRDKARRE